MHLLQSCNWGGAARRSRQEYPIQALQRGLHVGVQWLHNYADGAHVSGCGMLIQVCSVAHIENALDLQGDNDYKL
eukprot:4895300-Pyramimonas_sp.AAC.1